nr:MAG TPA: hypothetical protein [Caudoviricetes sp.]
MRHIKVILYENPFNFWKTLLEREGNQKLSFIFVCCLE